ILDGLNRRARLKQVGIGLLAVSAMALGGYTIHKRSLPPPPEDPPAPTVVPTPVLGPEVAVAQIEPAPAAELDAGVPDERDERDGPVGTAPRTNPNLTPVIDAGVEIAGKPLRVIVTPAKGSEVKIDDEPWTRVTEAGDIFRTIEQDVRVQVRND